VTDTWRAIDSCPRDGTPVLLANFGVACLLTNAPHVWAARFDDETLLECSLAAQHDNGGPPTHWAPLPLPGAGRAPYKAHRGNW
jgi:hypothetical protein